MIHHGSVATVATVATEPWWIISSAAAALHGADVSDVADVDLLMSVNDACRVLALIGIAPRAGTASPLFKSEVFGLWRDPPLPVEIMGGFQVATSAGWRRVRPLSRECVAVDGHALHIPSKEELIGLYRVFGRPKDLQRVLLLEELANRT